MPNKSQNFGAWVLLLIVIQLTLWVRSSAAEQDGTSRTEVDDNGLHDQSAETPAAYKASDEDDDPCRSYRNCGSCTFSRYQYSQATDASTVESRPTCHWCSISSTCHSPSKQPEQYCIDRRNNNQSMEVSYQFDCPLGPVPYPDKPPELLPNWMQEFHQAGLLDHVRLTDLSLPGTHDSLTFDLSLTVSEDGMDGLQELAKLLHTLSGGKIKILPGELEEFFRMQAKTQQLTVTQQLDNGVRFLDFRIMWEPDKKAWYSIHFMQSKHPAEEYLRQIRKWLDEHPQEVLVIWLSKHGSTSATGQDQYPGVSPGQKEQFWNKYTSIFSGLMQATNETSIFETPVAELIGRNHRLVTFASDYQEFAQSSPLAMDAAQIQNSFDGGDGVFEEANVLQQHLDYFRNASINNARINDQHGFTLLAMNTASPSWQVISAAKHQFLHWLKGDMKLHNNKHLRLPQSMVKESTMLEEQTQAAPLESNLFHSCSSHIKIPGIDHWCPQNLFDISQLASFYNQIAIEVAYHHSSKDAKSHGVPSAFPNAFYIDVLDYDGTIRVGPQLMDGSDRGDMNNPDTLPTKQAKYGLVDTVLAYNAGTACNKEDKIHSGCKALLDRLAKRRSKYPLRRWKEPRLGRHDDWPISGSDASNPGNLLREGRSMQRN
ncbi:PI-PLC X domain-containing protein 1 [Seminavis robusta]|uniref:PI-PLC X domain-containing protein 1 n=1 Tax=Seminavis robusta TaxID=568900 RepID=A0A9N8HNE9_9STRA|nr:PI-PLC X domain-containing protein 1 [Seminavis robusta]|eukprot:Sro1204_g252200.1 PI-PLC X domain-containing protein 1 (656) ;mRNA; f:15821-17883